MNLEDNLRDRLESVATPPSQVDVEMLVIAGRRRAFRRRATEAAGGVALVTAVLLAVPWVLNSAKADPPAPRTVAGARESASASPTPGPTPTSGPATTRPPRAPGDCRMEELAVPDGTDDVAAAAVDPTGRFIVGNGLAGQNLRAVLWTDGRPRELPRSGDSVRATGVNAAGIVVGLVSEGAESYAFRYENGELTRLQTPDGHWHVYPEPAINGAGDVVINAEPAGNTGGEGSIVLLWKAGTTTATRLPLPDGAHAMDIADDGTLVGAVYVDGSAADAYAWEQGGKGRKLERPEGSEGAAAYAVAGEWATGGVWSEGDGAAAVWSVRTGALASPKLGDPGTAVNSAGWTVDLEGAVARGGAPVTLEAGRGQTAVAKDVSDTGLVVGQAVVEKKQDGGGANLGPRVWHC